MFRREQKMEKRESTLKFYGGTIGPWIPVLFMLAGMLVSTVIGGGGLNRLTMISFFALALGFLLQKTRNTMAKQP